ncbi:MAG: choice-of-anchor tandem repeat GloVer-containing protein [Candidatus Sulfotelmatobacter sp.]|jgi:uncharacterized repeat protein (TIGR03803 family)
MQQIINKLIFSFAAAAVAFSLSAPRAQGQTEKIIYSFTGGTDGTAPSAGLAIDGSGNLYGGTEFGGTNGAGTIFELSPGSGGVWIKTVLYTFGFNTTGDVWFPTSNLVLDAKGNLYGIGPEGGAYDAGGIFELSPGSNGIWTEKVIYSFTGGTDIVSFQPYLSIDSAGNLYGYREDFLSTSGTTSYGAVFQIQANANGTWVENILHTFSGGNDGSAPYDGQLTLDSAGNVYGQAYNGARDFGLVFELVRGSKGSWTEKTLHTFTGAADGSSVAPGALVIDPSGNIFGTSVWNAFELVPDSNGTWTEKILHTFSGGSDGTYPESGLTPSPSGTLYGVTYEGGLHHGTVFQLSPGSNGTWTENVLHRFTTTGGDGIYPSSPLVLDGHGNLFGSTANGGISNNGVVFEVTP